MSDDIKERASGLHDIARQAVHLDEAVVADDQPFGRIEHDDALGHVVEHDREQAVVAAHAKAPREPSHGIHSNDDYAQQTENNDGEAPVLLEHMNSNREWPRVGK